MSANPHQIPVPLRQREIPLSFVEVEPTVAVAEPPPDAKYYSFLNSVAANPDPPVEKPVPKVDGRQTKVVQLENVLKPNPFPLQPALPPEKPVPEPAVKPKPVEIPVEKVGDLAKVKSEELKIPQYDKTNTAKADPQAVTHLKPRTLAEARQAKSMLAGEKMKQDGGSSRHGKLSFDTRMTPFGAYDAAFFAAIQQHWWDLIDESKVSTRAGKVVIGFNLLSDGRITDMRIIGNEVSEMLALLCERAIIDPAPYPKWPSDMKSMIGKNPREMTISFVYYTE